MKKLFILFTIFTIITTTQLSSFGEVSRISNGWVYYSDGSNGRMSNGWIYNSDGTNGRISNDWVYYSDGSSGRISGNRIYSNREQYNKNNEDDEEEKTSSSSSLTAPLATNYKLGPKLIDKKDIKNSYKKYSYITSGGTKCTRIEEVKVIQKEDKYEIYKKVCDKYGFIKTTYKTITTLVPYNDEKFKVTKFAHKGLFGQLITYRDE